jgi:hypothetical protein
MAYHDVNREGLTFSEWAQAAGLYKPMQGSAYGSADCVGYSTSTSGYRPVREGERRDVIIQGYFYKRTSSSTTHFPLRVRQAWRNGEDPSDHLPEAPRRWRNPPTPAAAGDNT